MSVRMKNTIRNIALLLGIISSGALIVYAAMTRSGRYDSGCTMPDEAIGTFVQVKGGGFIKGAGGGVYPEETPPTKVLVSPFLLQVHEVTNDQFAAFVADTGYVTEGEQRGGSARFVETRTPETQSSWWTLDEDVTWKTPEGAGSDLEGKGRHPVVHVTLKDARAYAKWEGGRLPTEVEWEYAASLGLFDPKDPESGARAPDGTPRANTWDGPFPTRNTEEDGYAGAAPVGCFEASRIGAYDMIGNVWEWTTTRFGEDGLYTIKGGSFLCGANHCRRYRTAARQGMEPDFSTAHIGFRIVKEQRKTTTP